MYEILLAPFLHRQREKNAIHISFFSLTLTLRRSSKFTKCSVNSYCYSPKMKRKKRLHIRPYVVVSFFLCELKIKVDRVAFRRKKSCGYQLAVRANEMVIKSALEILPSHIHKYVKEPNAF